MIERRRLGKTGMEASVLGFGGSEIGYQRASFKSVERLLGGALDAGLNVIDTAECYEDSEELIGRAVGGRRSDYHLFTKCGHARGEWRADWRPAALLRSIERSLKRLRTDRVDLLQLHSCSLDVLKRGDAIAALETRAGARVDPLHRLQRRRRGGEVGGGERALRHAPDVRQHRRPGSARPDAPPRAPARYGRHRQAAPRQCGLALRAQAGRALLPGLLGAAARAGLPVPARSGPRAA